MCFLKKTIKYKVTSSNDILVVVIAKLYISKILKRKLIPPFISGNGKYCRYDESVGKILEINE